MEKILIRLPEVLASTGYKRSSLYSAIASGEFPPPRRLGRRSVAWHVNDISTWADQLPTADHYTAKYTPDHN
ncbi:MAG: helix-turn-helix transcriptional regulator [bacterium]